MLLTRFRQDRRASVLPLFAAMIVPVIGAMGAAIDYGRVSSVRTEMQAALDATALMLAKEPAGQTDAALTTKATTYFQALFTRPEAKSIAITASAATTGGSTVTVSGSGTVPTTFT